MNRIFQMVGKIEIDNAKAQEAIAQTQKSAAKVSNFMGKGFLNSAFVGFSVAATNNFLRPLTEFVINPLMNTIKDIRFFNDEMHQALNSINKTLGISGQELRNYQRAMEEIYTSGYGNSIGEVGTFIEEINHQLGSLDYDNLVLMGQALDMVQTHFRVGYKETLNAAKVLTEQFGLESVQAMDYLVSGFQHGMNASDDFLDTIREYGSTFKEAGFTIDEMFSILESGMDGGVLGIDKIADMIKEGNIRIKDGSDTTYKALQQLGMNADSFLMKINDGTMTTAEAMQKVAAELINVDGEILKSEISVALFGTQLEDLAFKGEEALLNISDGFRDVSGATEELVNSNFTAIQNFNYAIRELKVALTPIVAFMDKMLADFLPHFHNFIDLVRDITSRFEVLDEGTKRIVASFIALSTLFPTLILFVGTFFGLLISLASPFLAITAAVILFRNKFSKSTEQLLAIGKNFVSNFLLIGKQAIQGFIKGFSVSKLLDYITQGFSRAVEGVKSLLGISSPSKVFRWIAEMLAAGLGEGFSADQIYDAMTEFYQKAITLFEDLGANGFGRLKGYLSDLSAKFNEFAQSNFPEWLLNIYNTIRDIHGAFSGLGDNTFQIGSQTFELDMNIPQAKEEFGKLVKIAVEMGQKALQSFSSMVSESLKYIVAAIPFAVGAFVMFREMFSKTAREQRKQREQDARAEGSYYEQILNYRRRYNEELQRTQKLLDLFADSKFLKNGGAIEAPSQGGLGLSIISEKEIEKLGTIENKLEKLREYQMNLKLNVDTGNLADPLIKIGRQLAIGLRTILTQTQEKVKTTYSNFFNEVGLMSEAFNVKLTKSELSAVVSTEKRQKLLVNIRAEEGKLEQVYKERQETFSDLERLTKQTYDEAKRDFSLAQEKNALAKANIASLSKQKREMEKAGAAAATLQSIESTIIQNRQLRDASQKEYERATTKINQIENNTHHLQKEMAKILVKNTDNVREQSELRQKEFLIQALNAKNEDELEDLKTKTLELQKKLNKEYQIETKLLREAIEARETQQRINDDLRDQLDRLNDLDSDLVLNRKDLENATNKIIDLDQKREKILERVGAGGRKRITEALELQSEQKRIKEILEEKQKLEQDASERLLEYDNRLQGVYAKQKAGIAISHNENKLLQKRNTLQGYYEKIRRSVVELVHEEAKINAQLNYKTNIGLQEEINKKKRIAAGFDKRRLMLTQNLATEQEKLRSIADYDVKERTKQANIVERLKNEIKSLGLEEEKNARELRDALLANSNIEELRNNILKRRAKDLAALDQLHGQDNSQALSRYEAEESQLRDMQSQYTLLTQSIEDMKKKLQSKPNLPNKEILELRANILSAEEAAAKLSAQITTRKDFMAIPQESLERADEGLLEARKLVFAEYTQLLDDLMENEQALISERSRQGALSEKEIEVMKEARALLDEQAEIRNRIKSLASAITKDEDKKAEIIGRLTKGQEELLALRQKEYAIQQKFNAKQAELEDANQQIAMMNSEEFTQAVEANQKELQDHALRLEEDLKNAKIAAEESAHEQALALQAAEAQAKEEQLRNEIALAKEGQAELAKAGQILRTNIFAIVGMAQAILALMTQITGENKLFKFLEDTTNAMNEGKESAFKLFDVLAATIALFGVTKGIVAFRNLLIGMNFAIAGGIKLLMGQHVLETQLAVSRNAMTLALTKYNGQLLKANMLWRAQLASVLGFIGVVAAAIAIYRQMEGAISKATAAFLGFVAAAKTAQLAAFFFGETIKTQILASIAPLLVVASSIYAIVLVFNSAARPAVKFGVAVVGIVASLMSVVKVLKTLGIISTLTWSSVLGPVTAVVIAIGAIGAIIFLISENFNKLGKDIQKFGENSSGWLKPFKDFFVNTWQSISNWFKNLGPDFRSSALGIGKQILQGLYTGLGLKAVVNLFKMIVRAITGTVEEDLDINSPSGVFQYYGEMILSGLFSALNPMKIIKRFAALARAGIDAFRKVMGINSDSQEFINAGAHIMGGLSTGVSSSSFGDEMAQIGAEGVQGFSQGSSGMGTVAGQAMGDAEAAVANTSYRDLMGEAALAGKDYFANNQDDLWMIAEQAMSLAEDQVVGSGYERALFNVAKEGVSAYRSQSEGGLSGATRAALAQVDDEVKNSDLPSVFGDISRMNADEFNSNAENIRKGAQTFQAGMQEAVQQDNVRATIKQQAAETAKSLDETHNSFFNVFILVLSRKVSIIEKLINVFLSVMSGMASAFLQLAQGNWQEAWKIFSTAGLWGIDSVLKIGLRIGREFNNLINVLITNVETILGTNPFSAFVIQTLVGLQKVQDYMAEWVKKIRNFVRGLITEEVEGFHIFNIDLLPAVEAFKNFWEKVYDIVIGTVAKILGINEAALIAWMAVVTNGMVAVLTGFLTWTAATLSGIIPFDVLEENWKKFWAWATGSEVVNTAVDKTVDDIGLSFQRLPKISQVAILAIIGHVFALKKVLGFVTSRLKFWATSVPRLMLRMINPIQLVSIMFSTLGKIIVGLTNVTTLFFRVINLLSFAPPIIGALTLIGALGYLTYHLFTAEEGMQKTIKTVGLVGLAFVAATVFLKKHFIAFFGNTFTGILLNASQKLGQFAKNILIDKLSVATGRDMGKAVIKSLGVKISNGIKTLAKPLSDQMGKLGAKMASAMGDRTTSALVAVNKRIGVVFATLGKAIDRTILKINAMNAAMLKFATPIAIILAGVAGLALAFTSNIHPVGKLAAAIASLSVVVLGLHHMLKALGVQAAITWTAMLGPILLVAAGAMGVIVAFTSMRDSLAKLGVIAASVASVLIGLVLVFGGGWIAAGIAAVAGIIVAFATQWEAAKKLLMALPKWMANIGIAIIQGLWWGLKQIPIFGHVFKAVENFWNWITGFFQTASPSKRMADLGYNVVMGFINGIKGMGSALVKVAQDIFAGDFHGKLIQIGTEIIKLFFKIFDPDQVLRLLVTLSAVLTTELQNFGGKIVDILSQSETGRAVLNWGMKLFEAFKKVFSLISSGELFNNLGTKIQTAFSSMFKNTTFYKILDHFFDMSSIMSKLGGFFKNLSSRTTEFGKNLIGGLVSGLTSFDWISGFVDMQKKAWESFTGFWGIASDSKLTTYGGEMVGSGMVNGLGNMLGPFQSMLGNFLPEGFADAAGNWSDRVGGWLTGGYDGLLKSQQRLENSLGDFIEQRDALLAVEGIDETNPRVQALNEQIDETTGKLANVVYQMEEAWDTTPIEENIAAIDEAIFAAEAAAAAFENSGQAERAELERGIIADLQADRAKLEADIALSEQRQTENLDRELNNRQVLAKNHLDEVNVMGSRQIRDTQREQRQATRDLEREMKARTNVVKQFTESIKSDMELAEIQIEFGFQDEESYIESLRAQQAILIATLQEEFDAGQVGTEAFKEVASTLSSVNDRINQYQDGLKDLAALQYEIDREAGKVGREDHIANLEQELIALQAIGEERRLTIDEQTAILELRREIRDERQSLIEDEMALVEARHEYELATNQASLEDYRRVKLEQLRAAVEATTEGTQAYYEAQMALIEFEKTINDERKAVLDARMSYQRTVNQGDIEATRELMNQKINILKNEISTMSENTAEYWQKKEELYNAEKELAEEVANERIEAIDDEIAANARLLDQRSSNLAREKDMHEARIAREELLAESGRTNYELEREKINSLEDFAQREQEIAIQRLESERRLNLEKANLIQNDEERAEEITRIEHESTEARAQLNHDFTMQTMDFANQRTTLEQQKIQEVLDFEKAIYEERMSMGDVGEQEVKANFSMEFGSADSLSAQFDTVKQFIGDIQGLYEQEAEERIALMEQEASARQANFERQKELENARLEMSLSTSQQIIEQTKFEAEIEGQLRQDRIDANEHAYEMNKARLEREIVLAEKRGASEEEIADMQLNLLVEEKARVAEVYKFKIDELQRNAQIQKDQIISDSQFAIESERQTAEAQIAQNRLAAKMEQDILRNTTEAKIASLEQGLQVALATIDAEMQARMAAGDISASQYAQQQSALNAIRADNEKTIVELRRNTTQQLEDMSANARNQETIAREQLNLSIAQQEQQLANELVRVDTDTQIQRAALNREFESQSLTAAQAHEDAKWEMQKQASQRRVENLEEEQDRARAAREKELEDFRYAQSEKQNIAQEEHNLAMARANSEQERANLQRQFEENEFAQRLARLDQEAALQEQLLQQQIADINRLAAAKASVEGADPVAIERERAQAVKDIQTEITNSTREQNAERRAILNDQNIWQINSEREKTQALIEERNKEFEDFKASLERKNQAYQESTSSVLSILSEGSAQRLALQKESVEAEFSTRASILDEERAMLEQRLQLETLSAEQRQEIQERLTENEREFLAANSERRMAHYEADKERRTKIGEEEIEEMRERGASEIEIEKAITKQRIAEIQHYIDARKELGALTEEQEQALMTQIEDTRIEGAKRVAEQEVVIAEEKAEQQKEIAQEAIDQETEAIKEAHEEQSRASQEASDRRIGHLERQKEALNDAYGGEETVAKIQKQAQIEIQIEQEKTREKIKQLKMQQDMEQKTMEMIISMKRAAGMITKKEEDQMRADLKSSKEKSNQEIQSLERGLQQFSTDTRNASYREASALRKKNLAERKQAEAEAHQAWKEKEQERAEAQRDNRQREIDREYQAAQHRIAIYEKEMEKKKNLLQQQADDVSLYYDRLESETQFNRSMEDQMATEAMQAFERDIERKEMLGTLSEEERLAAIQQRYQFEEEAMAAQQQRLAEDAAMSKARAQDEHAMKVQLINLTSEIEINKSKMAMKAEQRKVQAQISNMQNFVNMMQRLGMMTKEAADQAKADMRDMQTDLKQQEDMHNQELSLMNQNKNMQINSANQELNDSLIASDRQYQLASRQLMEEQKQERFAFEKSMYDAEQEHNRKREESNKAFEENLKSKSVRLEESHQNSLNRIKEETDAQKQALDKRAQQQKDALSKAENAEKASLNKRLEASKRHFDEQESARKAALDKQLSAREKMQDFAARIAAATTKEEREKAEQEYIAWLEELEQAKRIEEARRNPDAGALNRMANQVKNLGGIDVGNPLADARDARVAADKASEERRRAFEEKLAAQRESLEAAISDKYEAKRLQIEQNVATEKAKLDAAAQKKEEAANARKAAGEASLENQRAQRAEQQQREDQNRAKQREQQMKAKEAEWEAQQKRAEELALVRARREQARIDRERDRAVSGGGKPKAPLFIGGGKGGGDNIGTVVGSASLVGNKAEFQNVNVTIQGDPGMTPEQVSQAVQQGIHDEFTNVANKLRQSAGGSMAKPSSIGNWKK